MYRKPVLLLLAIALFFVSACSREMAATKDLIEGTTSTTTNSTSTTQTPSSTIGTTTTTSTTIEQTTTTTQAPNTTIVTTTTNTINTSTTTNSTSTTQIEPTTTTTTQTSTTQSPTTSTSTSSTTTSTSLTSTTLSTGGTSTTTTTTQATTTTTTSTTTTTAASVNATDPPASPVKLIFLHHSTGQNWLADANGGLGIELRDNKYFVSDTNYGWGPSSIGDTTDIGHWWSWFRGSNSTTIMAAVYAESSQNCTYTRLGTDPGGENEIVMFKSCYPNSEINNSAGDPPSIEANPLKGQYYNEGNHTLANIKGIYIDLLDYFETKTNKLFVVITAPPRSTGNTTAAQRANAVALNDWLVNDWLTENDGYDYNNVVVFDFFHTLTHADNHHRYQTNAVQYINSNGDGSLVYPSGDDHPSAAGGQKATTDFVPLLNFYYNTWKGLL